MLEREDCENQLKNLNRLSAYILYNKMTMVLHSELVVSDEVCVRLKVLKINFFDRVLLFQMNAQVLIQMEG